LHFPRELRTLAHTIDEAINRIARSPRPLGARQIADEIKMALADATIDVIYRDRVLTGRSRRYNLPRVRPESQIEITHTLLGIELKIGKRKLLCPDYATARYLSIFARLGGGAVAVPYDITSISAIADAMESSLQRMLLLAELLTPDRSSRIKVLVKRRLAADINEAVASFGAGSPFPEFADPLRRMRSTSDSVIRGSKSRHKRGQA
jgi:hypothetical protein